MRIPTIILPVLALCVFYFISMMIGYGIAFAKYHNDYNMISGCLKSCFKCDYSENAAYCAPISCYADAPAMFGMCALLGMPVSIMFMVFCLFIWVVMSNYIGCTSNGKRVGGVLVSDKHLMIKCCCDNIIDCDHNDTCCLSVECV